MLKGQVLPCFLLLLLTVACADSRPGGEPPSQRVPPHAPEAAAAPVELLTVAAGSARHLTKQRFERTDRRLAHHVAGAGTGHVDAD